MVTKSEGLAIAVIIYYVFLLPFAVKVCIKHGFGRHGGWLYLFIVPLVRIVGSSLLIAANEHPSTGLFTAAAIFSAVGLGPILLALVGIIKRINDGIASGRIGARAFQLIHILILVGIILAIVAGIDGTDMSVSTQHDGVTLRKAASLVLLAVGGLCAALLLLFAMKVSSVLPADRTLLWFALLSIPFLFVRLLLFVIEGFSHSSDFNPYALNIYIQAFMQVLPEFIVMALYVAAGLMTAKMDKSQYAGGNSELLPMASRFNSRGGQSDYYAESRN